ncbi:hypothetical protein A5662_18065 [Mycobacteriaceae bacterium 1482268.1]|nr:hypothetical protein A5662_18065 [Mycobacteriaceae bacterium 1482268.1]
MNRLKAVVAAAILAAAGTAVAPPSHAMMILGNYDVLTNRYDRASWVWMAAACIPEKSLDCVDISAISRLKYYYEYYGKAHLSGDTYTLVVDVPDGLRCPGQVLPSRDTYTWSQVTLAGEIHSSYDVGCFGGPPGTQFWTFALQRL